MGIILSPASTGFTTFKFGGDLSGAGDGIIINAGASPLVLMADVVGDQIMQSVSGIANALQVYGVTEIIET